MYRPKGILSRVKGRTTTNEAGTVGLNQNCPGQARRVVSQSSRKKVGEPDGGRSLARPSLSLRPPGDRVLSVDGPGSQRPPGLGVRCSMMPRRGPHPSFHAHSCPSGHATVFGFPESSLNSLDASFILPRGGLGAWEGFT